MTNAKQTKKRIALKGKTHRISINYANDATITYDNKNKIKSLQIKGAAAKATTGFDPVKWSIDETLYTFSRNQEV